MAKFNRLPIYPLLLAIYPVLAMLAFNNSQVRLSVGLRPLLIGLAAGMAVFAILRLLLHSWSRAALLTSLLLTWFFVYGHLYTLLKPVTLLRFGGVGPRIGGERGRRPALTPNPGGHHGNSQRAVSSSRQKKMLL